MEHEDTTPPNFLKDYSHARSLLKSTSRGKNPDWYREAYLLANQLHFFESGNRYLGYFWNDTAAEWVHVKAISATADEVALEAYFKYIQAEVAPVSCRSLGVILHINQDASVFEFEKQDWNEVQPGATLRELIRNNPSVVLQDRTLSEDTMSFRVFPTPASPSVETSGCAIATSRKGEDFLQGFRELGNEFNFPIRTMGLSSPLLLLSRLPRTLGAQEKSFSIMLRFDEFSFFGFYSAEGELIALRSIKHSNKQLPQTLEGTLTSAAASVELADLEVKAFDCRAIKTPAMDVELAGVLFTTNYQVFVAPVTEEEALPIELSTFRIEDDNPGLIFAETETFGANIAEGYHLQDFLSPSQEERDLLPGAIDMKILRIGRLLTRVGLAACLLVGAIVGAASFSKMSSKTWKSGKAATSEAKALSQELKGVRATETFLADRSKGWVTLELLARLFPLDGSVQFSAVEHKASAAGNNSRQPTAGLIKKWTVKGYAMAEATDSLSVLNTSEGIGKVFKVVQKATGNSSFDLDKKSRSVLVNLDLGENRTFNRDAPAASPNSFPYEFALEVTQRIEAGDPLSIPITKL